MVIPRISIPFHYVNKLRQAKSREEKDKINKEIAVTRIFTPALREWAKKNTTKTT